jgi:hypothetical protein
MYFILVFLWQNRKTSVFFYGKRGINAAIFFLFVEKGGRGVRRAKRAAGLAHTKPLLFNLHHSFLPTRKSVLRIQMIYAQIRL